MGMFSALFEVSADSTKFERGMANVAKSADTVGKKVASAFDGRAIGRTLATALGISLTDIADRLANFYADITVGSKAALDAMVEQSGKAADAQKKRTDEVRAAKKKEHEEALDYYKEIMGLHDKERKVLAEFDEAERARSEKIRASQKKWNEESAMEYERQEEARKKAIRLAAEEASLAEQKAAAEAKASAELAKQANYRTAGIAGIRGAKQFGEASTGALQEQASRNQRAIEGMGTFLNIGQEFEVARLQAEIANIRKELDFRSQLNANVSRFGVEGARSMFSGDPLAFDRLVQQYVTDARDAKQIAASTNEYLRQLNERQKSGIPVVNLNL